MGGHGRAAHRWCRDGLSDDVRGGVVVAKEAEERSRYVFRLAQPSSL